VLRSLLFGVSALDPLAFGGAALLFGLVSLAASYLPARRATRLSAVTALRAE
jgi:ABC-type antimicrobial peptide transport system permease subunit